MTSLHSAFSTSPSSHVVCPRCRHAFNPDAASNHSISVDRTVSVIHVDQLLRIRHYLVQGHKTGLLIASSYRLKDLIQGLGLYLDVLPGSMSMYLARSLHAMGLTKNGRARSGRYVWFDPRALLPFDELGANLRVSPSSLSASASRISAAATEIDPTIYPYPLLRPHTREYNDTHAAAQGVRSRVADGSYKLMSSWYPELYWPDPLENPAATLPTATPPPEQDS